jgi:hypothetical protein
MGCSARIRRTEDGEIGLASPAFVISAASSGPLQRASGTPVAAGIPESTHNSITLRLLDHAERHWPQLTRVQVTYRGAFGYITGVLRDGQRIRYAACATVARLIPSASRSTPPPPTATRTPSCAPGSRPAPRKKPSTPPAPSTSPRSATNQAHDPGSPQTNLRSHPLSSGTPHPDQNRCRPAPGSQISPGSSAGVNSQVFMSRSRAATMSACSS